MLSTDWIASLLTLTAMEVVLGIDNIVLLTILTGKLPREQQGLARRLGLGLALGTRILLLLALSWVLSLTRPVLELSSLGVPAAWLPPEVNALSWRDIILIVGGVFLIAKSTYEIHEKLEGSPEAPQPRGSARFGWTLAQIAILDIIFSLDSVITAVGMARHLWVMITAMVVAVGMMLVFAGPVGDFVHRHPTVKMLALSFLILIGVMLVAEGFGQHIDRGYIYFAMAFSLGVEMLNLRARRKKSALAASPDPPGIRLSRGRGSGVTDGWTLGERAGENPENN
jgi:predicted tellurium resistance membrane protein TerC